VRGHVPHHAKQQMMFNIITEVMNSYQLLLPTVVLYICPISPSILQQGRAGNISPNV